MTVRIHFKPCDECGCFLVSDFECGCGAVHEPYCQLCGRFAGAKTPVSPDRPAGCDKGREPHHHTPEEKTRYQMAVVERMQKRMSEHPRQDDETITTYLERLNSLNLA